MTYYKCDRCGAEIPYKGERKKLVITDIYHDYYDYDEGPMERHVDLCDSCGKMLNNFLQKRVLNYNDISGGMKNG